MPPTQADINAGYDKMGTTLGDRKLNKVNMNTTAWKIDELVIKVADGSEELAGDKVINIGTYRNSKGGNYRYNDHFWVEEGDDDV